jgi:hypothetical protein
MDAASPNASLYEDFQTAVGQMYATRSCRSPLVEESI